MIELLETRHMRNGFKIVPVELLARKSVMRCHR
jgi:hypothetical protein